MSRVRFVTPEVVRLPLSDGDWIDVKKELNAGETRAIFTDLVKDFEAGKPATLDAKQVGLTKVLQYLVGWSFVDSQGRGVPISLAALQNLFADDQTEVIDAVEAHDQAIEKLREERKNARASTTVSAPIS